MLEEKIKKVKDLGEHILIMCAVDEIEKEIEDSDEILSCVLDIQRCIWQEISAAIAFRAVVFRGDRVTLPHLKTTASEDSAAPRRSEMFYTRQV